MKYGVCLGSRGKEYISIVKNAGYDYIEGTFNLTKEMDKTTFDEFASVLKEYDIKAETFNSYFPKTADIHTVGDDVDLSVLTEYSKIGFEKAAKLGGKIIVIGSGKSRIIPDGFSVEKAKDQYAEFLCLCGDIALEYGMSVVIEPLNKKETNFINTVQDGIDMSLYSKHKNVFGLADFFHMYKNGETLEAIEKAGNMLRHVHIARPNDDRAQPTLAEKNVCLKWSSALKKCGYNDRITLESRFVPDFEHAIVEALPALKLFD